MATDHTFPITINFEQSYIWIPKGAGRGLFLSRIFDLEIDLFRQKDESVILGKLPCKCRSFAILQRLKYS